MALLIGAIIMCHVDPENIGILRFVAEVFLLCAFFSIGLGKTYCKRMITRMDEPVSFWGTVIIYFLLGMMILLGTWICPH